MEQESYQYYSTQRPVDIGTFPKPADNPPTAILNYDCDQRIPVEGEVFQAWGELTYAKPLTAAQIAAYELRPSRNNPDIHRVAERKTAREAHTRKSTRNHER